MQNSLKLIVKNNTAASPVPPRPIFRCNVYIGEIRTMTLDVITKCDPFIVESDNTGYGTLIIPENKNLIFVK
jgi:hypothetical protein